MSDHSILKLMLIIDIAILAALIVDAHYSYCMYQIMQSGGKR